MSPFVTGVRAGKFLGMRRIFAVVVGN